MSSSETQKASVTSFATSTSRNGPKGTGAGRPKSSTKNAADSRLSRTLTMVWFSLTVMTEKIRWRHVPVDDRCRAAHRSATIAATDAFGASRRFRRAGATSRTPFAGRVERTPPRRETETFHLGTVSIGRFPVEAAALDVREPRRDRREERRPLAVDRAVRSARTAQQRRRERPREHERRHEEIDAASQAESRREPCVERALRLEERAVVCSMRADGSADDQRIRLRAEPQHGAELVRTRRHPVQRTIEVEIMDARR